MTIAVTNRRGSASGHKDFPLIVHATREMARPAIYVATKGYDAERHHALVRDELKALSIIPARNQDVPAVPLWPPCTNSAPLSGAGRTRGCPHPRQTPYPTHPDPPLFPFGSPNTVYAVRSLGSHNKRVSGYASFGYSEPNSLTSFGTQIAAKR